MMDTLPISALESVKKAVQQPSKCSQDTVLLLRRLLTASDIQQSDEWNKSASTGNRRTTRAIRARTNTKVPVYQTPTSDNESVLSKHQKLVLATDVFNAASKSLSELIKTQAPLSTLKTAENKRRIGDTRITTPKKPLQPASPNRSVTRSPVKSKPLGAQKATQSAGSGVSSVADCARLALSSLRTLKRDETSGGSLNLQLEQGLCVLVGKMLSAGLDDMAVKELRRLKRRLLVEGGGNALKGIKDEEYADQTNEPLEELMLFESNFLTGQLLTLFISFQAHVLRIIASERKTSTLNKLPDTLSTSNPSSPSSTIMMAYKEEILSKDKAIQHLQSLVHTILSLASTACNPADSSNSSGSKVRVKSTVPLRLQLLALEIRSMVWTLLGHRCDQVKDLWDPLNRYFTAFARRSLTLRESDYESINEGFHCFQKSIELNGYSLDPESSGDASSLSTVFRTLAQLAHNAGKLEDSNNYYQLAVKYLPSDQHLQLALCRCKAAIVSIELLSKKSLSRASSAIDEAAEVLAAPLRGCQSDMEELLVESARLKKAAMGALTALENITSANESPERREVVFRLATSRYLVNFVRLLNRYLAPSLAQDGESTAATERLEKFRNIASAAVDSGVSMGKMAISTRIPPWADIEPLLSDCLRLLLALREEGSGLSEPAMPGIRSGFVKLSNLYWSLYISEKEKAKETADLVRIIERSVSVLQKSSPADQSSGLIAVKWEKLAGLYSECGQRVKSESAYARAIRAHVDVGALENITQSTHPFRFWSNPKSAGYALGRVLNAFMRTRLKNGRRGIDLFFDSKDLAQKQRAVLLERQMTTIMEGSFPNSDTSCLFPLVQSLLALYPLVEYPMDRVRVILQTLRFFLDSRLTIEESFREYVLDEAKLCLSAEDVSSVDYALSCLRLTLGFLVGHLPVSTIDRVIRSWVRLLQNYSRWEELECVVDDISTWKLQIRSFVDYLDSQGLWRQKICALAVLRQVLDIEPDQDYAMTVTCLSKLGLQYCRLGYTEQAHAFLARAETLISQHNLPPLEIMTWHLAYAEHLLAMEKTDKGIEILSKAGAIFEQSSPSLSSSGFQTRCALERFVSDATYMLSRISMQVGNLTQAMYYAKSALKLSSRIWARLDKYAKRRGGKSGSSTTEQGVEAVTNQITTMDLSASSNAVLSDNYHKGSLYWPHFAAHYNTLVHLSRTAAHVGLFQDAVYYGEQALQVGRSIGSDYSIAMIGAELGQYHVQGGQLAKGENFLSQAIKDSAFFGKHIDSVSFDMSMSSQYRRFGNPDDENTVLASAYRALLEISQDEFAASLDPFGEAPITDIARKVEELSIRPSSRNTRTGRVHQTKPPPARRAPAQNGRKTKKSSIQKEQPIVKSLLFSNLRGDLLRRQALALLAGNKPSEANTLLDEAGELALSGLGQISQSIVQSECFLATAIKKLASHGVYCVLHESPISVPSIHAHGPPTTRGRSTVARRTKTTTSKTKGSSSKRNSPAPNDEFAPLLSNAKSMLTEALTSTTTHGSTMSAHTLSFLLSRISMLTYATTSKDGAILDTNTPASAIELGRNTAFLRESSAIHCDKQLSEPPSPLEWPSQLARAPKSVPVSDTDLIANCLDILPMDWQVISLTLSADRSEFVISRLRAGQEPFLLCLPLKRSDPENVDEEEFDFDSGKAELQEIVKLANESAHATEARFDRKLKKQWWANRESLDERLKLLLCNIEAIWFGGFRGVFASRPQNEELLSRFIDSFQKILQKHLPSRNKRGTTNQSNASLDRNVMEMFVNIGSLDNEANPEDAVMDLLYFVVDILQFHGERNAYDEIDFDMMVVETLDAIRVYREVDSREQISASQNHTILILDRALHGFPWESLDCMQGSPVSRIPSLDCLYERILQSQDTHPARDCYAGFHIDKTRGSYILNPGGDLKSTQATFETSLSNLEGWTKIVERDPTEDEFKDTLENRSLLLYFGHGSGAQYIRGRTIKRLDRCAVTFLMGCSSGLMTEAGDFEPYGTPWNYMHAGSPALVATLWDVTDKDIDRFASSVFEQWGLVDASKSTSGNQSGKKPRGRQAEKDSSVVFPGPAGLDAAVARSRGACILKYLNGAAPVVYGVPVFLK